MSVEYSGAHSITFGDGSLTSDGKFAGMNTWTDWHLIPASRPTMAMPGFTTKYVEIPGRDGSIDLSEYLVKRPVYGDRSGSFEFYVDHEGEPDWIGLWRRISTFIHGQKMKMCLGDDPHWFYEGRFSINEFRSDPNWSTMTINYQVGPYKYSIWRQGYEDIVWDTFNFEKDYHWYVIFHEMVLNNETKSFTWEGSAAPYTIDVTCMIGPVSVTFNGSSRTFNSGESGSVGHAERLGNSLTVRGTGKLSLGFREGSL